MAAFKIKKKHLKELIDSLAKEYRVFIPVESDGVSSFKEVTSDSHLPTINSRNTDRPPKEIFFPQTETLFTYKEGKISPPEQPNTKYRIPNTDKIAIFGARPCDVKSFSLLDRLFGMERNVAKCSEYKDTYWINRRTNALIFTIGCNHPLSTCFCNWLNGGPFNREGSDLLLTDIGEDFLVEPCSQNGEEFIKTKGLPIQKAAKVDIKRASTVRKEAESTLSEPVDITSLKEDLDTLWDNPVWNEIAYKCLSCAACSYLCPTCYCFDIQDERAGNARGKRIRVWDSCMFSLFTKEASGHNPRPSSKERMRQRIMHKFNYFVENLGDFGCVGCGRCIRSCPVNMDIREVINTIKNVKLTISNEK